MSINIAPKAYPGHFDTPRIEMPPVFFKLPWEQQQRRWKDAQTRQAAYLKTLRGRLDLWQWHLRGRLADFIAPRDWRES